MSVLQSGALLGNETLISALTKLKTKHNFHSINPYFYTSLTINEWKHNIKLFKPEGTNIWRHTGIATPTNSHEPFIIPIHCNHNNAPTNNHYIMAARFNNENTHADWDLVLVNSLDNHSTLSTAKTDSAPDPPYCKKRDKWTR